MTTIKLSGLYYLEELSVFISVHYFKLFFNEKSYLNFIPKMFKQYSYPINHNIQFYLFLFFYFFFKNNLFVFWSQVTGTCKDTAWDAVAGHSASLNTFVQHQAHPAPSTCYILTAAESSIWPCGKFKLEFSSLLIKTETELAVPTTDFLKLSWMRSQANDAPQLLEP